MGKKIRTFFICSLILLIFAGFLFFLGWTQFKVKPYTVGVVVSKTGGISSQVVENGSFSWHWEFLIPSNAELKLFSIKPYTLERKISGVLPSGEVYAALYKNQPDFSYNFDFSITVAVSPDAVAGLVKSGRISDQKSLDEYTGLAADDFIRSAVLVLIEKSSESELFLPETMNYDEILDTVKPSSKYPDVVIEKVSVKNVRIPDYVLYKKAKDFYLKSQVLSDNPAEKNIYSFSSEKSSAVNDDNAKALELLSQLKSIFKSD